MSDTKSFIHEVQRTPNRINTTNKTIPRDVIFKLKKIRDKEKYPERTQRRVEWEGGEEN